MSVESVLVIVLNWNRWHETRQCVEALWASCHGKVRVLVVDNGSTDGSVGRLRSWLRGREGVEVLPLPGNEGFSGGNNVGLRWALENTDVEFVFLLNNDAWLKQGSLEVCLKVAHEERASIVGTLVKDWGGEGVLFAGARFPQELFRESRLRPPPERDRWPVDIVQGCAMLIRRHLLEAAQRERGWILDPRLFMYGEELEFCVYAKRRGYGVWVAGDAIVYHGPRRPSPNPLALYYMTRNRVHLARWLLPQGYRCLFHLWYPPTRLLRVGRFLMQGKPSGALAILEGLMDGYRGVVGKWKHHDAFARRKRA